MKLTLNSLSSCMMICVNMDLVPTVSETEVDVMSDTPSITCPSKPMNLRLCPQF
jgi:hypothetical protein